MSVGPWGATPPIAPQDSLCPKGLGAAHQTKCPNLESEVWGLAPHASQRAKDASSPL